MQWAEQNNIRGGIPSVSQWLPEPPSVSSPWYHNARKISAITIHAGKRPFHYMFSLNDRECDVHASKAVTDTHTHTALSSCCTEVRQTRMHMFTDMFNVCITKSALLIVHIYIPHLSSPSFIFESYILSSSLSLSLSFSFSSFLFVICSALSLYTFIFLSLSISSIYFLLHSACKSNIFWTHDNTNTHTNTYFFTSKLVL